MDTPNRRRLPSPRSALACALLLALAAPPTAAQWSEVAADNTPIAVATGEQVLPKIASASDGGLWVGWFDNRTGAYTVRLQRLDADGVPQLGPDGLLVSDHPQSSSLVDWDLLCDSADHAVLVFTDTRDGSDLDVFAYRIAPDGTFVWGPDGKTLSSNNDFEPAPKVCETTNGDLAFVWARLPSSGDGGLMLQRVSPVGQVLLAAGGVTIVAQPGEDPAFCDVVPAPTNAVIVSWVRDVTTFASPRHVRARKFGAGGGALWPTAVNVYDAASVPIAHQPGLVEDGVGGALLWWHSSNLSNVFSSFVQHLDAGGNELFPHNGQSVSNDATSSHLDPSLVYDQAGGDAYVFWNRRNALQSMWGINGQRLDAAGTPQWGGAGLEVLPLDAVNKSAPRAALGLGGGAMVFLSDEPGGVFGDRRVLGRRFDAAGTDVWGGTVVASSTLSTKSRLPMAADCTGAAKLVWEDDRNGTPDLYGQRLAPDGSLGGGGPWTDLGGALAGSAGTPVLTGSGALCPGLTMGLSLSGALANTTSTLVIGVFPLQAPFKGGTMVPDPLLLLIGLPIGAAGTLDLAVTWPGGVPSGVSFYAQHWIVDAGGPVGFSASNGVRGTAP